MQRVVAVSIFAALSVLAAGCPSIVVDVPPIEVDPDIDVPPIDGPDLNPFECNTLTQEGCGSGQFCNAANVCQDRFGNNHACLADRECRSDICSVGFCAECTSQGDCASDEWCDAFGDCRAQKPIIR